MHIQHLLIADYAEIVKGKLYLMGGAWDTYYAREAPVQMRLAIAIGVQVDWDETNVPVPVRMFVEDDDGKQLARIEGQVQVGRPASLAVGSRQVTQMAVNLGLKAQHFGGYRVRAEVGEGPGMIDSMVPFRVLERRGNA